MDQNPPLSFREPELTDAVAITRLIGQCPPLDINSHYVSLLLCRDFHATCVLAECDSEIVGFVSAYRPPPRMNTVFVWQVAVDGRMRGQRLASRMLDELLARPACSDVTFLEATVTPSNTSSQRLFQSLAKRLGTECRTTECFTPEMYGEPGSHEPEELYCVGPFAVSPRTESPAQLTQNPQ